MRGVVPDPYANSGFDRSVAAGWRNALFTVVVFVVRKLRRSACRAFDRSVAHGWRNATGAMEPNETGHIRCWVQQGAGIQRLDPLSISPSPSLGQAASQQPVCQLPRQLVSHTARQPASQLANSPASACCSGQGYSSLFPRHFHSTQPEASQSAWVSLPASSPSSQAAS